MKILPITDFVKKNVVRVVQVQNKKFGSNLVFKESNLLDKNNQIIGNLVHRHNIGFSSVVLKIFQPQTKNITHIKTVHVQREFFPRSTVAPKSFITEIITEKLDTHFSNKKIISSVWKTLRHFDRKILADINSKELPVSAI